MPLYDYSCARCGEKREIIVRAAQATGAPECPACGAPMERAWSPVACHTKAGGGSCGGAQRGFS